MEVRAAATDKDQAAVDQATQIMHEVQVSDTEALKTLVPTDGCFGRAGMALTSRKPPSCSSSTPPTPTCRGGCFRRGSRGRVR